MKTTPSIDLRPADKAIVLRLLATHLPDTAVWAFGSRVQFCARPDSDLDLVAFTTPAQSAAISDLREAFEASSLPFRVDLHEWDDLPENFQENIKGGEVSPVAWASSEHSSRPAPLATASSPPGAAAGASATPLGLPKGWRIVSLGSISEKIGSGATPTGGASVYLKERKSFAFVRSQNVLDGRFDSSGLVFITDAQADLLKNVWLQENDVLLNITGDGETFGRTCLTPPEVLPACVNQHVSIVRANKKLASPKYINAFLMLPATKSYIESFNAGGSRRAITKGSIESFQIPLPPLLQQQKISTILSALDDKIALNRATNQTLEQIAQALFKSWFVDFDPVHAKARGEQPLGMDAATATLFPDGFQESELGMIPAGWELQSLYELADYLNGAAFREPDFTVDNSGLPIIKIAELKQGISGSTKYSNKPIVEKYIIRNGDVLYSWSGSPETSLDIFKWFGKDGLLNQHIFKLTFSNPFYEPFVYSVFQYLKPVLIDIAKHKQTTGLGHVTIGDMKKLMVVYPGKVLIERFYKIVSGIYFLHSHLLQENNKLSQIRDSLLPKLLSGEISVTDTNEALHEIK